MNGKHTQGEWKVDNSHCNNSSPYKERGSVSIISKNGYLDWYVCEVMGNTGKGDSCPTEESIANAQLIASAPKLLKRVEDLEQAILRFKAHTEELGGNYTQEEFWKMINLVTVDRPYFPPVEFHNDFTGKTETTKD